MTVILAGSGYHLVAERRLTWTRLADGAIGFDDSDDGRVRWVGGAKVIEVSEPVDEQYELLERLAHHPDWQVGP